MFYGPWVNLRHLFGPLYVRVHCGLQQCTVRPTTGLFRTVEPNSPRTVYGLPLYRFDSFYIVYMVPNTIFHHAKVLPLGFLGAFGLPDAP